MLKYQEDMNSSWKIDVRFFEAEKMIYDICHIPRALYQYTKKKF